MRSYSCIIFLYLGFTGFAQNVKVVNIQANNLVYNYYDQKLYCTIPGSVGMIGNSIAVIDPITGLIDTTVYLGSEPMKMAVSDNGKTVAVGLDGSAEVALFDVPTKAVRNQFSMGSDGTTGLFFVNDIEFLPDNDSAVLVSRRNYGFSPMYEGIAVYDNGIMRPSVVNGSSGSNTIEFVNDSIFFGYNQETTEFGIRKHVVDVNGVADLAVTTGLVSGFYKEMIFGQGKLIFSNGKIINVSSGSPVLAATIPGMDGPVAIDTASNMIYYAFQNFSSYSVYLRGYNSNTYVSADTIVIHDSISNGSVLMLVSWGENRLAYITDSSQIIIIEPGSIGINENASVAEFKVYPNPVKTNLLLESSLENPVDLDVYSVEGSLVFSNTYTRLPTSINVEHFPPGVYFLSIRTGASVCMKKFIKI